LDDKGYVRLTDFGIAKIYQKENSSETSGTPGYMAPEVMCAQNHTIAVDYFALGVMTFEFMFGKRPYVGKSRKEIKEQIMAKQVQVKKNEIPEGWSIEAADFINKLLQRKPANRLGLRGASEVKDHIWLKNYPWKDLYEKKLPTGFIPKIGDNFDQKYCQQLDKIGQNTKENYDNLIRRDTVQNYFKLFTFISPEDDIKKDEKKIKDRKFTNPHSSLVITSSDDSRIKTNDRSSSLIIENKLSKYKNVSSSSSTTNLVFKGMKKSNSVINYNYSKSKPGSLKNSYILNN